MLQNTVIKITWLLLCLAGCLLATVIPASKDNTHMASTASASLTREARDYGGYAAYPYRSFDRPQSRCISCLYAAMTGQDQNRPSYMNQREYEDRNWYYQPDRYDDRTRYAGYDNRYYDRNYQNQNRYNDDRYDSYRPNDYYERNDYYQNSYNDDRSGYRGNGYDNRDPIYNSIRGSSGGAHDIGYYDDRLSNRGYGMAYGGNSGYYPRPNFNGGYRGGSGYSIVRDQYVGNKYDSRYADDRYNYDRNRGGYDDRNFRPWDQTNRGVSGFDSSGRGHYYATNKNPAHSHPQPALPSADAHQQSPPRPFQSLNSPSSQYHNQNNQQSFETSTSSGNSKPSYANDWGYADNEDRNSVYQQQQHNFAQQNYGQNQEKDAKQSPSYGDQQGHRTLGTSYLHERDTPTTITTANNGKQGENSKPSAESHSSNDNSSNGANASISVSSGNSASGSSNASGSGGTSDGSENSKSDVSKNNE